MATALVAASSGPWPGSSSPVLAADACPCDCNGDGAVSVSELITAVRIGLGEATLASCPAADRNHDGLVGIDELVAAVNAALNGCPPMTPTVTPAPESCPFDFDTDFERQPSICAFRGRWNDACGQSDLEVTFVVLQDEDGRLAGAIVADDPVRVFVALPLDATQALVMAHGLLDEPDSIRPVGGSIEIEDGGRRLVVDPTGAPFEVRGCGFDRFVGEFARLVAR